MGARKRRKIRRTSGAKCGAAGTRGESHGVGRRGRKRTRSGRLCRSVRVTARRCKFVQWRRGERSLPHDESAESTEKQGDSPRSTATSRTENAAIRSVRVAIRSRLRFRPHQPLALRHDRVPGRQRWLPGRVHFPGYRAQSHSGAFSRPLTRWTVPTRQVEEREGEHRLGSYRDQVERVEVLVREATHRYRSEVVAAVLLQ